MRTIKYRQATIQDSLAIIELYNENAIEIDSAPITLGFIGELMDRDNFLGVVATENDLLVGFAVGYKYLKNVSSHSRLEILGVVSQYRGQKIGQGLIERFLNKCPKNMEVSLCVHIKNERAQNLYQKYGFTKIETRFIGMIKKPKES